MVLLGLGVYSAAGEDRGDRCRVPFRAACWCGDPSCGEFAGDHSGREAGQVVIDDTTQDLALIGVQGSILEVSVVGSAVEEPALGTLLVGAGDAGSFVSGFVVRECHQLTGEEASFMPVEIEEPALY